MTTYLENIKTGEKRKHKDSTTAAKRLWAMPYDHRMMWQVVDKEGGFELSGADTWELVVFLNPYNWRQCLSKPEARMIFDWEECLQNPEIMYEL